jgi:hypothetical protein
VIQGISPPEEVVATINIVVDASNVDDASTAVQAATSAIQDQNDAYDVFSEVIFRTSAPTFAPSVIPSQLPTSTTPSSASTMIGWITTISASTSTTTELNADLVNSYANEVVDFYGVEPTDVSITTSYESSGSISLTISDDVPESEIVDTITSSIANSLGVHPQNVKVDVDMETGEVEFFITSDSFSDAAGVTFSLDNYQYQSDIIEEIEAGLSLVEIGSFDTSKEVIASIDFIIDANNAANDLTQASWQSQQLLSGFEVRIENSYVTHAPTFTPSIEPTSSLPTRAPSLTGSVAIVQLARAVTESVSQSELSDIQSEVAETYGVDAEDVNVQIVYQTTGSIQIDASDSTLTKDELTEVFEAEIATLLGIHEGNVAVKIENGVASYVITSDTAETAQNMEDSISKSDSIEALTHSIEDVLAINVLSVEIDDGINAEVVVTVDTRDAENNLNNAADAY